MFDTSTDDQHLFIFEWYNLHMFSAETVQRNTFLAQMDQVAVKVEHGALLAMLALSLIQFCGKEGCL